MKMRFLINAVLFSLAFCFRLGAAQEPETYSPLPVGTAIPVTFTHTLDALKLKVGDPIIAKTDQVIILAGGQRIPRGAKLIGSVIEVQPMISSGGPSELAIKFGTLRLRDRSFSIHVAIRAMASFVDSYSTRSPAVDHGYPNDSVYRQVGGDYFYPNDTVYSNEWDEVGKDSNYGVFVKLRNVQPSDSRNHVVCDSTDNLQSVGVFASSACGVYGFQDLTIDASGSDNSAIIRFHSTKHAVKIAYNSTALFQVAGTMP
jgi:hypothetical protein